MQERVDQISDFPALSMRTNSYWTQDAAKGCKKMQVAPSADFTSSQLPTIMFTVICIQRPELV